MDAYVEKLYAALTDALRQGRSRPFSAPVTVAEIYQDLVPYRVVRSTIGFEMNADYEHALLELLAGSADYARLEPEEAAEELRAELSSPNPNVGLFRKFAACDVWIADPGTPPEEAERFAPEPTDDERAMDGRRAVAAASSQTAAGAGTAAPPAEDVLELDATEVVDEARAAAPARPDAAAGERRTDGIRRCGFCDATLPAGRLIRFCPYCGGDQTRRPCASCGESLEQGWRFCVACGAPQEG
jgi:hypothetical protein